MRECACTAQRLSDLGNSSDEYGSNRADAQRYIRVENHIKKRMDTSVSASTVNVAEVATEEHIGVGTGATFVAEVCFCLKMSCLRCSTRTW